MAAWNLTVDICISSDYQYKKGKSWYWVDDDEYVIAAKPIDGYVKRPRYIHISIRKYLADGYHPDFATRRQLT